jgi:hypothetical protein
MLAFGAYKWLTLSIYFEMYVNHAPVIFAPVNAIYSGE